jgi:hypothetical protein
MAIPLMENREHGGPARPPPPAFRHCGVVHRLRDRDLSLAQWVIAPLRAHYMIALLIAAVARALALPRTSWACSAPRRPGRARIRRFAGSTCSTMQRTGQPAAARPGRAHCPGHRAVGFTLVLVAEVGSGTTTSPFVTAETADDAARLARTDMPCCGNRACIPKSARPSSAEAMTLEALRPFWTGLRQGSRSSPTIAA